MSAPYDGTVVTASGDADPAGQAGRTGPGRPGRPTLTAALGAACISSSAILVTLAHVGAATTAFYRCALSLLVLIPLAALEQRRHGARPLADQMSAVVAGLFLAVDLVLWNHAIADVGAGAATVLGNLQVIFVAIIAWLVLRERPERRFLAVLPLVLLGVVMVSGMLGHAAGSDPTAGVGYGVATSAAYACFILIMRRTSGHSPHVASQLAEATVGAAIGSLVLGLVAGGLQFGIPERSFLWLLALAMLSGTVGWLLITASLPRLPAATSSLLLLLQPAGAMVLADVVLSQRPTLVQIAGALLVCLGVLAATWRGPLRTKGRGNASPASADTIQAGAEGQQSAAVAESAGVG